MKITAIKEFIFGSKFQLIHHFIKKIFTLLLKKTNTKQVVDISN